MSGWFGLQSLVDFDGIRNSLEKAFILSYSVLVTIKKECHKSLPICQKI